MSRAGLGQGSKPGARSYTDISHIGGSDPITYTVTPYLSGLGI